MFYVQSYISNVSFPTTLDEVYDFARSFNLETLLGCDFDRMEFDYEKRTNLWTAPKWCKKGDIVFFMHAKTAFQKIARLRKQLLSERSNYTNDEFWLMMNALIRAKKLYNIYGGKIFAIGRISGEVEYDPSDVEYHWKSNIYAPIDSIFLLETPIDISEFNQKIIISRQSSITPLFGEDFEFVKNLILSKNTVVEDYLLNSIAEPMPLSKISDDNWIEIVNRYRRSFFLETQFRTFYVNRLLKYLGDLKTIYKECPCKKKRSKTTFVDNVIKLNDKYLPVEIKLSVSAERDISAQLESYCGLDTLILDGKRDVHENVCSSNVLVIDTENVYIYSSPDKSLKKIYDLDDIQSYEDISVLRCIIIEELQT